MFIMGARRNPARSTRKPIPLSDKSNSLLTKTKSVRSKSEDENSPVTGTIPVYKKCRFSDENKTSDVYKFDESSDEESAPKKRTAKRANKARKKAPHWKNFKNLKTATACSKKIEPKKAADTLGTQSVKIVTISHPVRSPAAGGSHVQVQSAGARDSTGNPAAMSTPVRTTASTPVRMTASTPVGMPTSTPVGMPTSTPVGMPTSTPVKMPTSTPVGMPTSTPAERAESISVSPAFVSRVRWSVIPRSNPVTSKGVSVVSQNKDLESTGAEAYAQYQLGNSLSKSLADCSTERELPKPVNSLTTASHQLTDNARYSLEQQHNESGSDMSDFSDSVPRSKVCIPKIARKLTMRGGSILTSRTSLQNQDKPVPNVRLSACEEGVLNQSSDYSLENSFGFDDEENGENIVGSPTRLPFLKPLSRPKLTPSAPKLPIKEVHALLMGQKKASSEIDKSREKNSPALSHTVQTKLTDFVNASPPAPAVTLSPVPLFGEDSLEKDLLSPFTQQNRRSYDRMPCRRKVACGDEVISDDEIGEITEDTCSVPRTKPKTAYHKKIKKKSKKDSQFDQWATELASHFNEVDETELVTE